MSSEPNGLAVPPKLSLSRLRRAILEELCVTGRRLGTLGWQTSDGSKVGPKIPQDELLLSREKPFSAEAKSATSGDPCRRDGLNPFDVWFGCYRACQEDSVFNEERYG